MLKKGGIVKKTQQKNTVCDRANVVVHGEKKHGCKNTGLCDRANVVVHGEKKHGKKGTYTQIKIDPDSFRRNGWFDEMDEGVKKTQQKNTD